MISLGKEGVKMAQVLVRNIGDDMVAEIKKMAETHGRSMQKELKHLLIAAVSAFDNSGAIYPPVKAVNVIGVPASKLLIGDRR